jgi:hypothetical protein
MDINSFFEGREKKKLKIINSRIQKEKEKKKRKENRIKKQTFFAREVLHKVKKMNPKDFSSFTNDLGTMRRIGSSNGFRGKRFFFFSFIKLQLVGLSNRHSFSFIFVFVSSIFLGYHWIGRSGYWSLL